MAKNMNGQDAPVANIEELCQYQMGCVISVPVECSAFAVRSVKWNTMRGQKSAECKRRDARAG